MALEIIKLAIDATSTVTTGPAVTRFFYRLTALAIGPSTITIDAADFLSDTGAVVTELPALETDNSFINVYINGVLQMAGISTYTPGTTGVGELEITVPSGVSIGLNTPVVLEVVNFTPTSTVTVNT